MRIAYFLLLAAGCGTAALPGDPDADVDVPVDPDATPQVTAPLDVEWLGVQGFLLRRGDDSVLTAPLFSRPSMLEVTLGLDTPADVPAIDASVADLGLADLDAIVSGHAHYDHLMDVPRIMTAHAPGATLFANTSARHIFAALAPDSCGAPGPIARSRVVALDDPASSKVDYRGCPALRPAGAPLEGTWVDVPGASIRVMALCSVHPDQIGPIHFGEGAIDEDLCALPASANGWLEGGTLSFLIDFLDDAGGVDLRVYYQDAPGNLPVGAPPADVLAEAPVDLALLNVGNYDAVEDHPTAILAALAPRVAVSGHWEDFLQPLDSPEEPIPLMDLDEYVRRAEAGVAPGLHVLPTRWTTLSVTP